MEVYRQPSAMEPLLPRGRSGQLSELTCEVLKAAGRLTGQVHSPLVLRGVAELVREMNCYYSNLIEGHKTIPRDIERAMKRDFSRDETQHNNQQLSLAHIAVEKLMDQRLAGEPVDVYSPDFVCWLHHEFYTRLPEPLHWATTKKGKRYQIKPGSLRDFMVDVGKHTPPDFNALPSFLSRFHSFYGDKHILEGDRLVVIAVLILWLSLANVAHGQLAYWAGNGHYYEAITAPGINWYDANDLAASKGGYLASVTSAAENAFIYGLIRTNAALWEQRPTGNSWGPWIGGWQIPGATEPDGGWSWVTGEPLAYANWNLGEPSNGHGTEDRIHFWGQQAPVGDTWNDRPANEGVQGLVIEYESFPKAVCLNISLHNTNAVEISWASQVGVFYTVEYLNGFAAGQWSTLTNVVGNDRACSVFDSISQTPRFYRVLGSP